MAPTFPTANARPDKAARLFKTQARAAELGGRCLARRYVDNKAKMAFECSEGHLFEKSFNKLFQVGRRSWCPHCAEQSQRYDQSAFLSTVAERGGICAGPLPVPLRYESTVALECALGHGWTAEAGRVTHSGQWCPKCAKAARGPRLDIAKAREICASKGGRCLSEGFRNRKDRIECECAKGHRWLTTPFGLQYSESWCHVCVEESRCNTAEERAAGLARLRAHAAEQGGACLSEEYTNSNERYDFRCSKGHSWSAHARNVLLGGSWCPECSGRLGETLAIAFARKASGLEFAKERPRWLMGRFGKPLELDAHCEARGLAIEYQGQQHYEFIPGWHKTIENFEAGRDRDRLKRELCAARGVLLFEIANAARPNKERVEAEVRAQAASAAIPAGFNPIFEEFASTMNRLEALFEGLGCRELGPLGKAHAARMLAQAQHPTAGL